MASFTPFRPLASSTTTSTLFQQSTSSFSTTTPFLTKTIQPQRLPKHVVPPYPYGPRLIYKQSNSGLYGVTRLQTGNNVSEKHDVKTARFWRPNIHVREYYIESLNVRVKTKLSMRVLKTIKKEGSLEAYLLKNKPARVKALGPAGWNLRWLLTLTEWHQAEMNAERVRLGLPEKEVVDNSKMIEYAMDWATPGRLSMANRQMSRDLREEDAFDLTGMDDFENLSEEKQAELVAQMEQHAGNLSHLP